MIAFWAPDKLTVRDRFWASFTARYTGIGFAESVSTLWTLNNIFEFHMAVFFKDNL
ncbi:MAG: hypothetical protein HXS47_13475 [Theionarchaea archaeon]|nr:hypothetical protein [Theionarchaea archaeon]